MPLRLSISLLAALAAALVSRQSRAAPAEPPSDLYLIAGTATNYSPETFPATLYKVIGKNLMTVRSLAAASDGVYLVAGSSSGVLAVLSPHVNPARVQVVHPNRPETEDRIELNLKDRIALSSLNTLFVSGKSLYELIATSAPPAAATAVPPATAASPIDVKRILLEPASTADRISAGSAQDYARLEFEGLPGGPEFAFSTFVSRADNQLMLKVGGSRVVIDTCQSNVALETGNAAIAVIAANADWRIFAQGRTLEQLKSNPQGDTVDYVHNLKTGIWKPIAISGNVSRQRLFGPWLTTIVQHWAATGPANPGRSAERDAGTKEYPSLQHEYASFQGKNAQIPGSLTINNLEDDRRIVLTTNAEDSEILQITTDNQILYRVNDSIFEAPIKGATLGAGRLIVRDPHVPEVHWVMSAQGAH